MKKGILKIIGDPKTISEALERGRNDGNYFSDNYRDLSRRFPDEFVAVLNQEVVGHDRDYIGLIRYLKNNSLNDAYVERTYVDEKPPILILSVA